MVLTSGAWLSPPSKYSKAAFDYLDNSVQQLAIDVDRATEAITLTASRVMVPLNSSDPEGEVVSIGNTSVRTCCFRWAGGGMCPTPRQGLLGFLADSVATEWGPHRVEPYGVITSMMQMAQLELLLPAASKEQQQQQQQQQQLEVAAGGEPELLPLVMYYTLDGSTPSSSGRRITQAQLEEEGGVGVYLKKLVFSHTDYGGQPLLEPVDIIINAISSRTQPISNRNASLSVGEDDGVGSAVAVNSTNSTKKPEQSWVDSDMTSITFTLSPLPEPSYSIETIEALTTSMSVIVGTAVAASIGASVGSSIVGSSAGGGGGTVGNPLELVEQVQFMAITGSMSVPLPDEYRSFAGGFSWINLQFRPPGDYKTCSLTQLKPHAPLGDAPPPLPPNKQHTHKQTHHIQCT
jgi:hypothetical protein